MEYRPMPALRGFVGGVESGENMAVNEKIIEQIKTKIEFLASHNKNYNNTQYYTILDIEELLKELK